MEELTIKNPWLGLESYKEGEVLYGRDDDIRDLSQCVLNDVDTLLYGKSGIGKSSILNAGIIPAARRHGFLPVLVRLSHKEQQNYLYQIKESIANAMIPIPLDEYGNQIKLTSKELQQRDAELKKRIVKVVDCKDAGKESLYEYYHRHTFYDAEGRRIRLLIIFDQFEEIFTLQSDEPTKKSFFAELADLLNDKMPEELQKNSVIQHDGLQQAKIKEDDDFDTVFNDIDIGDKSNIDYYVNDNEIHFVFTIREDFLSEFEYYSASIPSLKQNRYGLRPINEEQAAQIIMRPVPGLISKSVAKLIIEKVTGKTDFKLDGIPEIEVDSAVLSLYLNRLYEAKTGENITDELVEAKGSEIIADFYKDAISSISDSTIEYLEGMLLNGKGRRDNITVFDAINDGGATESELDILINKKKILRQFNYAGDLRIEYVHDILCPVVKTHKEERLFLKKQAEEDARREKEKAEEDARIEKERLIQEEKLRKAEEEKQILLRKQQLQEEENRLLQRKQEEELARAEREKKHQQEQLARAEEERRLLLRQQEIQEEEKRLILRKQEEERIQQEREKKELEERAIAEKKAMEEKALRIKKKNHKRLVALISTIVVLVVISSISFATYWLATQTEFGEYYEGYVLENGWPKGVKKISKEEAYNLSISYRLWKIGYWTKHYNCVSIYGRGGQQTVARTPISTIIVSEEDAQGSDERASKALDLLHRTHYIYFRQDSELDEPVQMLCYDKEGNDKTLLYSINLSKEGDAVWNVFYDPEGKPLPMRDNGADRVKILRGTSGQDSLCYIYDSQGVPQSNQACILENNYMPFYGQELKYNQDILLDSIFFLDEFGMRHKVSSFRYPTRQSSIISIDSIATEGLRHILCVKRAYDNHGDCITETFYNISNSLTDSLYYQYDDWGRNILKGIYRKDDNVTKEHKISYYDPNSFRIKEKVCKVGAGRYPSSWVTSSYYREWFDKDIKQIEQKDENGYYSHQIIRQLDPETEEICFVNQEGQPIIDSIEVCHRKVTRIHHNTDGSYYQTEHYYDIDKKTLYSGEEYDFAVDSVVYDSYDHRIARVKWDKNMNIVTSYRIEYEGGRESYRYAMGIDGEPIRCPDWECDNLNYYKLQNITKFDGKTIVHLRAIDEYGLPCFLTRSFIIHKDTLDRVKERKLGMGWTESSSIAIPPLQNATKICYLHLLNKNGYAYKSGLKDGDILLNKNGSNYTNATISRRMELGDFVGENLFYVIRYEINKKTWSLHNAQMHKGVDAGAEVYPIYYTKEESELLKNALKQIK